MSSLHLLKKICVTKSRDCRGGRPRDSAASRGLTMQGLWWSSRAWVEELFLAAAAVRRVSAGSRGSDWLVGRSVRRASSPCVGSAIAGEA